MRLDLKSLLILAAGYLVLIGAFALAVDRWLHEFEADVTLQTAALLAREKAAILSERTYGALLAPDGKSRTLLRERLRDLTLLSDVPSSITVVDGEGHVIASDVLPAGQAAAKPATIFGDAPAVRSRALGPRRFLQGGDFVVDVPMVDQERLVGYIEFQFHSARVALSFGAARQRLLEAAVGGLVGVVLLGGLLQYQVARRAGAIADTLEEAVAAPREPPRAKGDEFGRALRAAGRVRQVLSDARRETSRLEESFGALAQALQVGVLLLRDAREPDFANPRALQLLGVASRDELSALWPELQAALAETLASLGRNDGARQTARLELPGSPPRVLRSEAYRLGGDDCDEYLVLLNDPELVDTLETDIRLANQLQGMARVYRTVAHELRAPLSAMMIHLDLLRESLTSESASEEDKEVQSRYVVVLRGELERLNRSLSETLTQTLPSPDQQDKFDLKEALQELGTLLAPQARRQGVELGIAMPDSPVILVGYRDRLKQSFLNIAVNALEAMPKGGRLSLEMQAEESRVRVSIVDTGRGIPEELLARIYERDFTTKGGGSGIGLYVARTLVEMHGGAIATTSAEGSGTRVEVTLPLMVRG